MTAVSVATLNEKGEARVLRTLQRRLVSDNLDLLIMAELQKCSLSGYDVIQSIYRRLGFLMSSGTVYSMLYTMERNGLIRGGWDERKRMYSLTVKGADQFKVILGAQESLQKMFCQLLSVPDVEVC